VQGEQVQGEQGQGLDLSRYGEQSYDWEASALKRAGSLCRVPTQRWREKRRTGLDDIMTKIEAVIQNSKLEAVKTALQEIGVEGMTVIEVRGHGRQKGHTEVYRGREYSVDLIPKTKLEMVLADAMVEKAVQAILAAARSGKIGDGKVFLSRVDEAIRIRNDERGEGAL
jgi:nitrogen regulatory protein P-II 1